MNIIIVSNLYPPRLRGGAEIIAETMARGFHAQGHAVTVITTAPYTGRGSRHPKGRMQDGVKVYSYYPFNLYDYFDGADKPVLIRAIWHLINLFNVSSARQLKSVLASERPDVVITHNLMGLGFLIPRMIAKGGYRLIHVLHDVQLYSPSGIIRLGAENSGLARYAALFGYPALMRWLFRSCTTVVAPSQFLIDFYHRHGFFKGSVMRVIQNPIGLEAKPQRVARGNSIRFLYVGTMNEAKGAVGLAHAFHEMKAPNVQLTMVGEGSESLSIESIAAQDHRIHVRGRIPHAELPDLFASHDVLILPSLLYDTFPTIAAESLRCGVPVLAFASGGVVEIVQDGSNGWILPVGDWQRLRDTIMHLAEHPDEIDKAALRTQEAVSHLTADAYCAQLVTIVER